MIPVKKLSQYDINNDDYIERIIDDEKRNGLYRVSKSIFGMTDEEFEEYRQKEQHRIYEDGHSFYSQEWYTRELEELDRKCDVRATYKDRLRKDAEAKAARDAAVANTRKSRRLAAYHAEKERRRNAKYTNKKNN